MCHFAIIRCCIVERIIGLFEIDYFTSENAFNVVVVFIQNILRQRFMLVSLNDPFLTMVRYANNVPPFESMCVQLRAVKPRE